MSQHIPKQQSAQEAPSQDQNLSQDLTWGPVGRHMKNLAIPSIMGSLFMTFYNVVDTAWAGKVGVDLSRISSWRQLLQSSGDVRALTGMTVSFPIFLVMLGLCIGAMSGTLALIGNALGRKDRRGASTVFIQALVYATAISLLLWAFLPLLPLAFQLMKVVDPVVRQYAYQYISILIYGNVFFSISFVFSAALIARGDTKTQRNVSILNFFINIFLDPLFLFGFGPIPAMGLQGIALATITSQLIGLAIMLLKLLQYRAFAQVRPASFSPRWGVLYNIARQSLPPSLNMMIVSFLLGLVNRYAYIYGGPPAVAAYGISLRIEQIALLPSIGLATALASIASQCNGAGKIERIRSAYRIALLASLGFLLLIMAPLGWLLSKYVLRLFTADAQTIAIGRQYLAICVITFYSYMLVKISGSVFQAVQMPQWIAYITVARNCLLPLLTFRLLPSVLGLGLSGVWWALVLNNWLAAAASVWLYFVALKRRSREAGLAASQTPPSTSRTSAASAQEHRVGNQLLAGK